MPEPMYSGRGLEPAAALFATLAHRGQRRRFTDEAYITHCQEVANIVRRVQAAMYMYDSAVVAVAWLHDTIEDCGVTVAELEPLFGAFVARGVAALTNPPGTKEERTNLLCGRFASLDNNLKIVKLADILHNAQGLHHTTPRFRSQFVKFKRPLVEALWVPAFWSDRTHTTSPLSLWADTSKALDDAEKLFPDSPPT